MAKALPSAQDLGVVTPQPSLSVASYKGATGMEDDAAQATMYAASGFERVAQVMEKGQERFDNLQAEDRYNQYQERLNKLALDPQNGWANAKGENAIKGDFNTRYAKQFQDERDKLIETLDTPAAKRRFAQLSATAAMQHRAKLYEHTAKERIAYEAKVASDTVQGIQQNIWRAYGDNDLFAAESARAVSVVEDFARGQGLNEQGVKNAVQELQSQLWAQRIAAATAAGDVKLAREYMGKATGVLTTKDKAEIDAKLKPQMKIAEAQNVVDDLFGKLVPANPNAPFPALELDAALRKHFDGDPEGLRMARAELGYRRGQIEIQQRESNNDNIAKVMQAFYEQKRSLPDVMKTPEYQALNGDAKARFINQAESHINAMISRAATQESRALNAEIRAERARNLAGRAATLQYLMNDEALAAMSPSAVAALGLEIGFDNAQMLANRKIQLAKPANMTQARMARDVFKTIAGEYNFKPELLTRAPKNETEREAQGTLATMYMEINQRIHSTSTARGKPLTPDEMEDLARKEFTNMVKIDPGLFSRSRLVPAISIPADGPKRVEALKQLTKPMEQIDPEVLGHHIGWIKKNRPGFERMTDAEVRARLGSALERAAGLDAARAPRELIEAVLRGEQK